MYSKGVCDCKSILTEVHGEGGVWVAFGLTDPGGLDYDGTCIMTRGATLGGYFGTWHCVGSLSFVGGVRGWGRFGLRRFIFAGGESWGGRASVGSIVAGPGPGRVIPCRLNGINQVCFDAVVAVSMVKTAQEVCEFFVVAGGSFRMYTESLEVVFHKVVEGGPRVCSVVCLCFPNVAE